MFTARNSSCGKVMFSEAYVKNSFHGKGEEVSAQEGFLPGGSASRREVCLRGGLLWGGRPPPDHYGIRSTSERYASYWNAFLLYNDFRKMFNLLHLSKQWLALPIQS